MNTDMNLRTKYERTLIEITRILPPNRVEQLVDFARFLEAQILNEKLMQEEDSEQIEIDNAQWDALLATEKGQILLEKLAGEALDEHRSGKTKSIAFDDEGQIVPR
jgi:hypothetical protein